MKPTGPTDPNLRHIVNLLENASRKNNVKIWRYVAERISKPRRNKTGVNLSRINRYTKNGDVVVVPDKVLGSGEIDHPVTIGAVAFSKQAYEKIINAGGKAITIESLVEMVPTGSNVRIIV